MRFGRLTVLRIELFPEGWNGKRRSHYICVCDCGNQMHARKDHIEKGITNSCGCYQKDRASEASTIHGYAKRDSKHPYYDAYINMTSRCHNEYHSHYACYGARGISVCERWRESFENFLNDMGERPTPNHNTIERSDNKGNYEPGNCRWATRKEQAQNRSTTQFITFMNKTQSITDWAAELGVSKHSLLGFLRLRIKNEESLREYIKSRNLSVEHLVRAASKDAEMHRNDASTLTRVVTI